MLRKCVYVPKKKIKRSLCQIQASISVLEILYQSGSVSLYRIYVHLSPKCQKLNLWPENGNVDITVGIIKGCDLTLTCCGFVLRRLWSIWKTNRNVAEKHTLIMLGSTSTYQSKPFISKGTIWVNNPSNNSTSKETAE